MHYSVVMGRHRQLVRRHGRELHWITRQKVGIVLGQVRQVIRGQVLGQKVGHVLGVHDVVLGGLSGMMPRQEVRVVLRHVLGGVVLGQEVGVVLQHVLHVVLGKEVGVVKLRLLLVQVCRHRMLRQMRWHRGWQDLREMVGVGPVVRHHVVGLGMVRGLLRDRSGVLPLWLLVVIGMVPGVDDKLGRFAFVHHGDQEVLIKTGEISQS